MAKVALFNIAARAVGVQDRRDESLWMASAAMIEEHRSPNWAEPRSSVGRCGPHLLLHAVRCKKTATAQANFGIERLPGTLF